MDPKFKKGDQVRVRTWEAMLEDFNINEYEAIEMPDEGIVFSREMKRYCGKVLTIVKLEFDY